ncbi:MAG: Ig-like domain-containing protein, partial [Isosphaeraceae bacterium]
TILPPVATQTMLSSSSAASVYGQPVTFTAAVLVGGGMAAEGNVVFTDGSAVMEVVPLVNSVATCTAANLSVTGHSIKAYYQGDPKCAASQSASFSQTVGASSSRTVLEVTPLGGRKGYYIEAFVTPGSPGAGLPSGSITFAANGRGFRTVPLQQGSAEIYVANRNLLRKWVKATYNCDNGCFQSSFSDSVYVSGLGRQWGSTSAAARPKLLATIGSRSTVAAPDRVIGALVFPKGPIGLTPKRLRGGSR